MINENVMIMFINIIDYCMIVFEILKYNVYTFIVD